MNGETATLTLMSWNVNRQAGAWEYLAQLRDRHGVQVALLQEAKAPPDGWHTWPEREPEWSITVPRDVRRNFASAVVVLDQGLTLEPLTARPLAACQSDGLPASHPGQFAAAVVHGPGLPKVLLISLYGLWDRMPGGGDIYAEATLHRAISDLTPLLQDRQHVRAVLGGVFNIFHAWSTADPLWGARYDTVFDRLAAYQLDFAGPQRQRGQPPLQGCPCRGGEQGMHVQTYRHERKEAATPYQDDYFTRPPLTVTACRGLNDEDSWQVSDHCPILARIEVT